MRSAKGERRRDAGAGGAPLWLYGRHAVEAALANPRRSCHRLLATREALARLGAAAERPGLEVESVARAAVERVVGADAVHQGLALQVAPLPPVPLGRACAPGAGPGLVVALDQVSDPRNAGAVLRAAAAFGARAVVVPAHGGAPAGGALAKAAAGALERVPLVEATNLARALVELKELGYWIVGLDAQAATAVDALPALEHLVLVLGAEGKGLRRLVRERCDLLAAIPIAPGAQSLNVAVAAGVALYALAGRRTAPHKPVAAVPASPGKRA